MTKSQQIQEALGKVHDQSTFLRELLSGALEWPVPDGIEELKDLGYDWTKDELRTQGLEKRIVDGKAFQILLATNQTWGIFLLEFQNADALITGRGLTGALRKVLRGLVASRRPDLPAFQRENLLFICADRKFAHYRFAYFKSPPEGTKTAPLATFGWNPDEPARTACEFNLPELVWPGSKTSPADWTAQWARAFDVEKVTKAFFDQYRSVFEKVEGQIKGIKDKSRLRLFTQQLFNRLMFIAFIQKKGWLKIEGMQHGNYLEGLWARYQAKRDNDGNFYNERLRRLFFHALSTADDVNRVTLGSEGFAGQKGLLQQVVGDVPYLNGGLFERSEDGTDDEEQVGKIVVPDAAIDAILHQLFARFNFTVVESTPLDIEVAVDPEMLGKVFEELVTGRHESGSYYTPKPIVSFMCREAIKGYLQTKVPKESAAAVAALVDQHNPAELSNGEAVLDALRKVRVCDPACGSGAYLLGMMHELLDLRARLFATSARLDSAKVYDRKLEIIQTNVYGVDIDPFAVNVARLRLWLSLAVDFDGAEPPPLPNLDFKIESGDSLAAPDPSGGGQLVLHRTLVDQFLAKKREYLLSHSARKKELRKEIDQLRANLKQWAHAQGAVSGFDWAVEFAEVFVGEAFEKTMDGQFGFAADAGKQLGFKVAEQDQPGGFDIVLANPPYVRMELIKPMKPMLRENFPEIHAARADLFCYFYGRAVELLRPKGMLVFISSNKWLKAGYGENLRRFLNQNTAIFSITDFGELPIFTAATFPMIFVAQKAGVNARAHYTQVPSMAPPYPDINRLRTQFGSLLPINAFANKTWAFAADAIAATLDTMRSNGRRLIEYVDGKIYYGIKSGLNRAFYIDDATRLRLIARNRSCRRVIKKLIVGDDVRRWRIQRTDRYLLYLPHDCDITDLEPVLGHLRTSRESLEARATRQEWYELQQPQEKYAQRFASPKIVFPDIGKESRFTLDKSGAFINDTVFAIDSDELYLLGVLNSAAVWHYLKHTAAVIGDAERGGRLRLKYAYVSEIPIPGANESAKAFISTRVQKCLDAQGIGCEAWEKEIDERVSALYGL